MQKMDGNSYNPQQELYRLLQEKCPEVFTEDKIDPEKLKRTLGEEIATDKERYGLSWAGKSDCFGHIAQPTTATLKPCREESVDFDDTENLFIEGDNLQVLKVLQKSYYGKVKMIYIDPPYNTGNDSFIYPDKFSETQDEYLQRAGLADEEGNLTSDGYFRKNSRDAGHFHSNWLSMMYPRLFLARNLLRPDGVIFVSIDENEVHNLRMIMNEIFGEENHLGAFVWKSRQIVDSRNQNNASIDHEYIVAYCKTDSFSLRGKAIDESKYSNPDKDPRGPWMSNSILGLATAHQRPNLHYTLIDPETKRKFECPPTAGWRFSQETMQQKIKDKRIVFPEKDDGRPREKKYLYELDNKFTGFSSILSQDIGYTLNGSREVTSLMGGRFFDFPKPSSLIYTFLEQTSSDDDIILDFFAGSGTTADAVMQLNAKDGGIRKFICVQLPEPCDEKSEAKKAGFGNIADIGKERIRRAAAKIKQENEGKLDFDGGKLDLGFKVFRLDESNFKQWQSDMQDAAQLEKKMSLFVDNVKPETQQENILYELLLKSGLDLNASVEVKKVNHKQYFLIDGGELIVCLEEKITQALADKIRTEKPQKFICLDRAFAGDDQLKTNTALQMEAEKIEFKVV